MVRASFFFIFLSLSPSLNLRFSLPTRARAFFYCSCFLRSPEKGAKDLGKKPKRNCQWLMAAEEVTEKERDSATRKMPGSRKFSLKRFPRYERLPFHETRRWSIRECRWHRLDASIVLRRLPRNCRHSSWLRFIPHCVRTSFSTFLNKTKFQVSVWRTIAWCFFRVKYFFPRVSHLAESGRRWFWREKLSGDRLRRIPDRYVQCPAICDFLVGNKNGIAAQHARVT